MNVLVIGAAGMIGRKFCEALAKRGSIGSKSVDRLDDGRCDNACRAGRSSVFRQNSLGRYLRPVVSLNLLPRIDRISSITWPPWFPGRRKPILTKGIGSIWVAFSTSSRLSRRAEYRPRVVFASSIAVFGTPFPEIIPEDFALAPLTSYGTQKAIGELLLGRL